MTHLFETWPQFAAAFAAKSPMLFFDYDGTLSPIRPTPSQASLPVTTQALLQGLSRRCPIVIISGRALSDLKQRVGVAGLVYVGNHGLEIEGAGLKFEDVVPSGFLSTLARVKQAIARKIEGVAGVLIEDKELTLSVHYRLVREDQVPLVISAVEEECFDYLRHNKITINAGKKVIELKPPVAWNKGKASLWLLEKQEMTAGGGRVFPIYVGDDVTDEDAFDALKIRGATVFVGDPGRSRAEFYLRDPQEVTQFLERLSRMF